MKEKPSQDPGPGGQGRKAQGRLRGLGKAVRWLRENFGNPPYWFGDVIGFWLSLAIGSYILWVLLATVV